MTYYTKTNEWITVDGAKARIGLTKAAQEHLGDVTFAELPALHKEVKAGDILATIESVKAVIELYAPVSGRVTGINDVLKDQPELLGESQESEAWVVELALTDPGELSLLLTREGYDAFLAGK